MLISVIEMAQKGTLYHSAFNYPNQFLSKLVALVCMIYSRLFSVSFDPRYSVEPYFIFRTIVALFSTGTIVVSYYIGNKLHKKLGICFALLVATYPEYVMMAKQVTGDATAHFFMALVILASLFYIENKSEISVFCMSMFAAMATLEKWHSAVACFYIAAVIILNCASVKKFFLHGIEALIGYVACLVLIAPNMLWNAKGVLDGILYMYSYDKDGITPYSDLLRVYVNEPNNYCGIGFVILVICGLLFMLRNFTRKYMVVLLGVIKLLVLCFLNRGFPRWAQEYYFSILLIAAIGTVFLVKNSKKILQIAGYALCAVICICFVTGSGLIAVTAMLSEQDTRIVQDQWCRKNGINNENSLSGYYTGYNPGGVSPYDNLGVDALNDYLTDDGELDFSSIETGIDYFIVSSRSSKVVAQLKDQDAFIIKEFSTIGNDIFTKPCIGITGSKFEIVRIYKFTQQIVKILNGGNTGLAITVYDISELK